jgi:hypothetical protein
MKKFLISGVAGLAACVALVASVHAVSLSGSTTFFTGLGDIVFPFVPPSPLNGTQGTIDNMAIGQTTPGPATFTTLGNAEVYNTNSSTSAIVLTAANVTGGYVETDLALTGAITTAQNAQLPTAASVMALLTNEAVGGTWKLRVLNTAGSGSGTFTITTNTGWTLTGTMTVAPNTWREFIVKISSASALTLQNVGAGVTP